MKDSNKLVHQAQQKIQTSSAVTKTPAGQKGSDSNAGQNNSISPQLIDAVTQIFAQFELVYHNQYNKAFYSADKEKLAKRLWLSHLKGYQAQDVLQAVDVAIRSSEFLPSVYSVLKHIKSDSGLPSARDAYLECCNASSPKIDYPWSHAVVYWAGKACGWHYLASQAERTALAVFSEKYQQLCAEYHQGQEFQIPQAVESQFKLARPLETEDELTALGSKVDAQNTIDDLKNMFAATSTPTKS